MKRSALWLLVGVCSLFAWSNQAQAGELWDRLKQQRDKYPPRYTRDSMSRWYVYRDKNGEVKYRQVYPGYGADFPPPAFLYYGYPMSRYYTGLGIDGTP